MKVYTHDKPTYCILTVYVIHSLRLAICVSLMECLLRLVFTVFGDRYADFILKDNSWLQYIYQINFCIMTYTMELVYISQTCEWMGMLFIIIS